MIETKSNSAIQRLKNQVVCPVELALRILGGKWRGSILYQLKDGPFRFSELKYRVQDAVIDYEGADNYLSNKVLSGHIKELMDFQLIHKFEDESGKTYYELTANGHSILPILIELFYWGEKQMRLPTSNQTS
ncbi:MAG: winged helix-turn-helix transcriptional regulator [Bacteroidia bacterium]